MKKTLLAGLATVLFFLTSTGIAMAGDDAKNKTDNNSSKTTGLYDNVRILQEQIDEHERTLRDWPITHELDEIIDRIRVLEGGGYYRFTDMGNGTIRDNNSGLIWLKDANCFSTMNWHDAKAAANGLHDDDELPDCGLTDGSHVGDWRLPEKDEWEAFVSPEYEKPALADTRGDAQWTMQAGAFARVLSDLYWTNTTYVSDTAYAWLVGMDVGGFTFGDKRYPDVFVWPVRSGN
jgi:hypothetical protein